MKLKTSIIGGIIIAVIGVIANLLGIVNFFKTDPPEPPIVTCYTYFSNPPNFFNSTVLFSPIYKISNPSPSSVLFTDFKLKIKNKFDLTSISRENPSFSVAENVEDFFDPEKLKRPDFPFILKPNTSTFIKINFSLTFSNKKNQPIPVPHKEKNELIADLFGHSENKKLEKINHTLIISSEEDYYEYDFNEWILLIGKEVDLIEIIKTLPKSDIEILAKKAGQDEILKVIRSE